MLQTTTVTREHVHQWFQHYYHKIRFRISMDHERIFSCSTCTLVVEPGLFIQVFWMIITLHNMSRSFVQVLIIVFIDINHINLKNRSSGLKRQKFTWFFSCDSHRNSNFSIYSAHFLYFWCHTSAKHVTYVCILVYLTEMQTV